MSQSAPQPGRSGSGESDAPSATHGGAGEPLRGWCAPEVQRELEGLGSMSIRVSLDPRRTLTERPPAAVLTRLRELSNRWRGPRAVHIRREPIPAAYRVFFRHIGLDPDITRTPIEAAVLERMKDGGFLSRGWLADVLTLALVDTAVPVWGFDAELLDGPLGIRLSSTEERLGGGPNAPELGPGRLIVADAEKPLAILFDEPAESYAPSSTTRELELFAVQVAGVPALHVEEALWACRFALTEVR